MTDHSQPIAGDAAIEALARQGITHAFGVPGTTTMHLLDALTRQDAVRWISTRHEQTAGHMADGFARGAGRPAVCMASRATLRSEVPAATTTIRPPAGSGGTGGQAISAASESW